MKILQVVDFFKPSWEAGGIVRVSYEISKKLSENGHEVTIYTTDGLKSRLKVKKNQPIDIEGMEVYYFSNVSNFLAKKNLYFPYLLPTIAKKDLRNFDIVHIHTFRSFLAVPSWYYTKKYEVPYVLQTHGSVLPTLQKQRLKEIFDIFLGYRLLKDSSKVIALTKTEAGQYKKMGVDENKIEIVPNGIDVSKYENLPEKGEFRRKYSIRDNEKIVLYLGRIHKIKGVDLLIKAFSDLIKELDDVRLVIVGPDDGFLSTLKGQIDRLKIGNKILFTGPLYEKDKLKAYIDANVLVYPSNFEIFGLVPFEAIMCGTPVIVTDGCGCGDIVREANCGYLIKYGDINTLKEKIKLLIENSGEGEEMVAQGQKYIKENLIWDKVRRKVEAVYEDCL